jgi:lipopolysaccharide export LptBFGC system permease protein LptF
MGRGNRVAAPIAGLLAVVVLFYSANRVFMGPAAQPNPPPSLVALLVISIFAALAILARIMRRGQKR